MHFSRYICAGFVLAAVKSSPLSDFGFEYYLHTGIIHTLVRA